MPSFDVVSKVDQHELTNAVDQAKRKVEDRYDLRGTNAGFTLEGMVITATAANDFQHKQVVDILRERIAGRHIDIRCLDMGELETNLAGVRQKITVKQGIEQAQAKKIIALIKESKLKVEAQIQGDKLRVSGKKKDDLQAAIALLRAAKLEIAVQFENFRD